MAAAKIVKKVQSKAPLKVKAASKTTPKPKAASLNLPKNIFGVKVNSQAIFDSIMSERASLRQGTHNVRSKSEVRGTGRKPFAQKGTGNARSGSKRSPQWVGGGVAFGPSNNRNYTLKVNKKVKRLAFKSALTLKAKEKAILINDFKVGEKPNTKNFIKQLDDLNLNKKFKKILIVVSDQKISKSAANLKKVYVTNLNSVRIETIVNADVIIFSKDYFNQLGGRK